MTNSISPILLGVNIDHVATLRQARGTRYPDPVKAAMRAEEAGADGITLHLREDRRHIRERDVEMIKEVLLTKMNLEMALTQEMLDIAQMIRPACVCIVPEKREELTTEGGLDVLNHLPRLKEGIDSLTQAGIEVSLFVDPEPEQIDAAREAGAPVIELHTGYYADAMTKMDRDYELKRIQEAARFADELNMQVNAGHGLNFQNIQPISRIPQIAEVNIGHALIARAVFISLPTAVQEMKRLLLEGRSLVKA